MQLRPYQERIISAVTDSLATGGLGQVHMACGSGKTLVAQRAAEQLLHDGGTAAVLVPSLALAAQTLALWSSQCPQLDVLAVCSDDSVADAAVHVSDLGVPVTTSTDDIAAWLRRPPGPGIRLVIGTYLSAHRLADAVLAVGELDLLVLDEAHHLAGRLDYATREILQPDRLPARRRLFMTATPREDLRIRRDSDAVLMVGMDDEAVFGPVLGRYPLAQGIADGFLEDYRIAVIGVRDSEARKLLADERIEYVDAHGAPSIRTVVAQIALGRARQQFGIQRALTFHPRVAAAAEFSRTLNGTLGRLEADVSEGLYAAHVHGEMDHGLRHRILDRLRDTQGGWAAISSARCLSEGVDLPAVDAVLFAHPKKSAVDITQAVGRALRRDPAVPGPSTIIVPLVVPDQDEEIGDLDPGEYETLWQVVRALRAHDEMLAIALDSHRAKDSTLNPKLPEKITMLLPPGTSQTFVSQISLLLVRQTTSVWMEGYAEAVRYYEQHQHLLVPAEYRTKSGIRLGAWIAARRHEYRRGQLTPERVENLEEIGMVWEPRDTFARGLDLAARYRAEHGHLRVPRATGQDSIDLCRWLSRQRTLRRQGRLAPEREAALTALGMEWEFVGRAWRRGMAAARAFHAEHGHLNVPRTYRTADDYQLGDWLNTQRIKWRKKDLPLDQQAELDELGMVWDQQEAKWQKALAAARAFHAEHGHLNVPHSYTTADGIKLGSWILHQRQLRSGIKQGGISEERIAALDALGMRWG
ncbi:DEAD/DEAH box helicase [Streptomyces palmae]|nr:DEAD/DEAH box helicase [Streptomyces palmae]